MSLEAPSRNAPTAWRCECGTELPANFLVCPSCHRLVHKDRLTQLTREAKSYEDAGDLRAALMSLREALTLLPTGTRQRTRLSAQTTRLSDAVDRGEGLDASTSAAPSSSSSTRVDAGVDYSTGPASPDTPSSTKKGNSLIRAGASAGGIGLLLWKFKFILVFVATKAKLLLLGLGKASTLLSMLVSLGVYWTIWGWQFALGVVLSIYVHEMGHVAALRRFGIPASAPMFIPGFGAVVRMETYPQTTKEDARVGLAGPIYGLGCAALVTTAYYATGYPLLAAIASVGAWINLFNLVPIWQLDGSRGFRALSKLDRWIFVVLAGTCGLFFDEGLYLAIAAVGVFRIFSSEAPAEGDRRTATEFAVLLVGLGLIAALNVPTPA